MPEVFGKPPGNAYGAWTICGISRWNHASEMLKQHNESKWHKDAAVAARMAKQLEKSLYELQCVAGTKEISERKKKNRTILLKLLCSA